MKIKTYLKSKSDWCFTAKFVLVVMALGAILVTVRGLWDTRCDVSTSIGKFDFNVCIIEWVTHFYIAIRAICLLIIYDVKEKPIYTPNKTNKKGQSK